jgi:hypothetical protein
MHRSTGKTAGIVVGSLVGFAFVAALLFIYFRRFKSNSKRRYRGSTFLDGFRASSQPIKDTNALPKEKERDAEEGNKEEVSESGPGVQVDPGPQGGHVGLWDGYANHLPPGAGGNSDVSDQHTTQQSFSYVVPPDFRQTVNQSVKSPDTYGQDHSGVLSPTMADPFASVTATDENVDRSPVRSPGIKDSFASFGTIMNPAYAGNVIHVENTVITSPTTESSNLPDILAPLRNEAHDVSQGNHNTSDFHYETPSPSIGHSGPQERLSTLPKSPEAPYHNDMESPRTFVFPAISRLEGDVSYAQARNSVSDTSSPSQPGSGGDQSRRSHSFAPRPSSQRLSAIFTAMLARRAQDRNGNYTVTNPTSVSPPVSPVKSADNEQRQLPIEVISEAIGFKGRSALDRLPRRDKAPATAPVATANFDGHEHQRSNSASSTATAKHSNSPFFLQIVNTPTRRRLRQESLPSESSARSPHLRRQDSQMTPELPTKTPISGASIYSLPNSASVYVTPQFDYTPQITSEEGVLSRGSSGRRASQEHDMSPSRHFEYVEQEVPKKLRFAEPDMSFMRTQALAEQDALSDITTPAQTPTPTPRTGSMRGDGYDVEEEGDVYEFPAYGSTTGDMGQMMVKDYGGRHELPPIFMAR